MKSEAERKKYEEYAYILDILPHGRPGVPRYSTRDGPLVQMVGEKYFTLLEGVARKFVPIKVGERVYIGKALREKVSRILGRVRYEDLTAAAKEELERIVEQIVKANEERFVKFFNEAQPVTPKMHALELMPGIGKRYMWQIVREREAKPFTSFDDIRNRTNIPDPVKMIVKRILEELMEVDRYRLFTAP